VVDVRYYDVDFTMARSKALVEKAPKVGSLNLSGPKRKECELVFTR